MITSQGTTSPPKGRFISGMIGGIAATFSLVSFAVAALSARRALAVAAILKQVARCGEI